MARTMKDSGIEWVGNIPAEWSVCHFKNILDIYNGNSIKDEEKNNYNDPSEAVPYIATKDIDATFQTITYDNGIYIKHLDTKFKRAPSNSILLCIEGGSAGKKIAFTDREVCFINKLCCFTSRSAYNKYIYYYMLSPAFTEEFKSNVSGLIDGVSVGKIKNFSLILPSLDEQKKIANFLDRKCTEIDSVIEKTKTTIEEYKKLKQSIITEAVTKGIRPYRSMKDSGIEWIGEIPEEWETPRIKNCFSFGKGLPITKENLVETGIPVISYGQIHSKTNTGTTLHKDLFRYVTKDYIKNNSASLVHKNDFIFADTSEDLEGCGNCVFVDTEMALFAGYHTIVLRPKTNIDNKYLAYLFKTNSWRSQIRSKVSGIKVFSISKKILSNTTLILPPPEEQKKITVHLDKKCTEIDNLIAKKTALLTKLNNYKKSIVYEYVTGKKEV